MFSKSFKNTKLLQAYCVLTLAFLFVFIFEALLITHSELGNHFFLWGIQPGAARLWWIFNDFRFSLAPFVLMPLFGVFLQWYTDGNEKNGFRLYKTFSLSVVGSLLLLLIAYLVPFKYAWDYMLQTLFVVFLFLAVQLVYFLGRVFFPRKSGLVLAGVSFFLGSVPLLVAIVYGL